MARTANEGSIRQLNRKCGISLRHFLKRSKEIRGDSGSAAGTRRHRICLPRCSVARQRPSVGEWTNWSNCRTTRPHDGFDGQTLVEKKDYSWLRLRGEPEITNENPNCRRSGQRTDCVYRPDTGPTGTGASQPWKRRPAMTSFASGWTNRNCAYEGPEDATRWSISPDRDAQFLKIGGLVSEQYESAGDPYFSVDTKAKEFLGQLFRKGRVRCSRGV